MSDLESRERKSCSRRARQVCQHALLPPHPSPDLAGLVCHLKSAPDAALQTRLEREVPLFELLCVWLASESVQSLLCSKTEVLRSLDEKVIVRD
jgi:hypothetical protein